MEPILQQRYRKISEIWKKNDLFLSIHWQQYLPKCGPWGNQTYAEGASDNFLYRNFWDFLKHMSNLALDQQNFSFNSYMKRKQIKVLMQNCLRIINRAKQFFTFDMPPNFQTLEFPWHSCHPKIMDGLLIPLVSGFTEVTNAEEER